MKLICGSHLPEPAHCNLTGMNESLEDYRLTTSVSRMRWEKTY